MPGPKSPKAPVSYTRRSEVLVRISFDAGLAAAADRGRPFLEGEGLKSAAGRALAQLAARVDAYQPPGPEGESW